jgi:pSer/pThr/pTyr-binding forkhead associated (FHA) protein
MEILCGKCKTPFLSISKDIFKHGPLFDYLKCAACGKITAVKKNKPLSEAENIISNAAGNGKSEKRLTMSDSIFSSVGSVPITITSAVRQQLYDLGYTRQDVYTMKPEEAQELISSLKVKSHNMKENTQQKNEVPGWLIVHDEAVRNQTFDLKEGKNIIGRKSSMPIDIAIETDDMTMSRRHCFIEVVLNEKRGEFDFLISDLKAINGTILNGRVQKKLSEQDVIYLNDSDTFQLGLTKIVFKKNNELQKKERVVDEVVNQPYAPTVVIDRDMIAHIYKDKQ